MNDLTNYQMLDEQQRRVTLNSVLDKITRLFILHTERLDRIEKRLDRLEEKQNAD